jgi:prophage regulatory protein
MRFLRVREVVKMVGFSRNTLYARIRAGTFPRPFALGPQTTAFVETEVLNWMRQQAASARSAPSAERYERAKAAIGCRYNRSGK